jgi:ubiquinone/menaquinone biosynthesis C-methylase UbiE
MAHVPLDDETIDVAIFSLSLMGSNFVDYLKEAKRCLKRDGWLWIAEPSSRISDIEQFKELVRKLGFYMIDVEVKDRFAFIKALKSEKEVNEVALDNLLARSILDK